MKELDEIRARLEAATPGPWAVFAGSEAHGVDYAEGSITWDDHGGEVFKPADAELIANAPTDLARLLAAVEAVEAALVKHGNPEPAIPEFGEFDTGYRAGRRALRSILEAALTAALTLTPAVPSGAGEPRGAGGEYLGVDEKRGAQKGVQP